MYRTRETVTDNFPPVDMLFHLMANKRSPTTNQDHAMNLNDMRQTSVVDHYGAEFAASC